MLRDIFQNNKGWIAFTYGMLVLEFVFFALQPYMLGKALDAMLIGDYSSFWIYVVLNVVCLVVGFCRRRMDTRVFARIWGSCVIRTVNRLVDREVRPTKIVSRCQMVRSFADFFEYHVPDFVRAIIEMTISSALIIYVVPSAGLISLAILLFSVAVMWFISNKTQEIDIELQHSRERADQAVLERDTIKVGEEYQGRVDCYIRRSDWDAFGWGVVDILSFAAIVVVIFALVKDHHTLGQIMSTLDYTWKIFNMMCPMWNFLMQLRQTQVADKFINKED